ncbi:tetratricopeptide repeat protein, partial [bacterium]|nr:tetratricopeptide repeat protein [bacterium]
SEAYNLIGDCYQVMGDQDAARIARQNIRKIVDDVSKAPLLDFEMILRLASHFQEDHDGAARLGLYQKSFNEIVTLLILYRLQYALPAQAARIEKLELSEPVLLALAGYYAHLKGDTLAGRAYIRMADEAAPKEFIRLRRGHYHWLAARYLRLIGVYEEALKHLERAESAVGDAEMPDGWRLAILEQRGLALLGLDYQGAGRKALDEGLALASSKNLLDQILRFECYLDLIDRGVSMADPAFSGRPDAVNTAEREYQQRKFAAETPEIYRSIVAEDYAGESRRPVAEAIMEVPLTRPHYRSIVNVDPAPYMSTGNYARAAEILEAILAEQGESVQNLLLLGEAHFHTARWEKSQQAFERVLELDPGNLRASEYLKTVRFRLENK